MLKMFVHQQNTLITKFNIIIINKLLTETIIDQREIPLQFILVLLCKNRILSFEQFVAYKQFFIEIAQSSMFSHFSDLLQDHPCVNDK